MMQFECAEVRDPCMQFSEVPSIDWNVWVGYTNTMYVERICRKVSSTGTSAEVNNVLD